MADTLEIFGTEYTNVAGIKATDENSNTKTYIRPQGTIQITTNGSGLDVSSYATADVAVSGGTPVLQTITKTYTPTTSQQTETITAGSGYDAIEEVDVTVNAMPTMTLPNSASNTSSGTSKATISRSTSNQYINIPTGYNGTAQYYTVSATPNGTVTAPSTITGTSATVSTGTNTLTLSKTVSVTPSVTTAGYVSSGTAGNANVSLTASVTTKGVATITPTTTNQTINSGTYITGTQTISGDANLVAGNIKSGTTIFGVTGNYTGGGGGTLTVKTATTTKTSTGQTISFSSLSAEPKYWFCRCTSQLSSSGSTTYYYITDLFYDGTNVKGNCFRIGSTRRMYNITSGVSASYSSNTLTITGGSNSGATPGQFYGASNFGYELVYIY